MHYLERIHNREISLDEYQEIYDEKFSELIMREMCQVINADCELQYSEGITTNLGGLNQARELIKQHFGVEE
jgi:hypothetical protein